MKSIIRKTFVMSIHPGFEKEYEERHNPIWHELEKVLREHGVIFYSISLHEETRQLFAYVEISDEELWAALPENETCKKWWKYMAPLMPSNADNSPVTTPLKEVFRLGSLRKPF